MADLLFPRGAFNTANLAAPAQGQTDTRYLINNTVISDGFVWRCRVDNPTSAPSDSNTTEWEKRSATNVQVWANDATTAIPANKLSNAGSAGAGFLFGDDARFVFSTTSDTFSTRTFTGITNVGTSTYIILDNLVEGGVTTQPAFDQLRNILIGDHTSGRTPQDHTFNMIPSTTSIVVPAGTFINSGQSTGGRGAIEFTFTGTNPFTNNIANQTGFIHIGAQARVGTLIAGRGLEGDVNGSLLTLDVNVPDNAVTSVSPQVLVNYTSIDTSLIQGAEVTVNFNNEAAAVRLIEHFGREAPNGSVSVHETTVLRINTGTPDATTFNLMTGDELRLTGLENNDAVSFFFDTVARAQSFATALGTSGGSFSIDANTRVVHSIADGSNTEIRRLTDDQNVLTNNIAVDLDILQADGNDPANGQMAVYDTAQDPDRWIAVNPDTRDILLSSNGANINIGDLVRGFTSSGNEPTDVYLATTTANGLMASAAVPSGWLHLNTGRLDNVLDQAPTWPGNAPANSSENFTVRTGDYYQVGSIVFIAIDEIAVTATNYASVTPADNNPFWRIINGHSNAATYPTSSVNFDATGTPDLHIERATIWVFNNNVWFWNGSDTTVSNAAGRTANEPSSTNNNWIQLNGGTGGGSSTFLGLTDTPSTFGNAGQVVAVNSGGTGLIFADASGGPAGSSDHPLWNSVSAYSIGNIVIDDNRLFRCISAVSTGTASSQHITSSEFLYISTPIDNQDQFLRFTFNSPQEVMSGTYHFRFLDDDGNEFVGTFPSSAIEDDDGNSVATGSSSDKWLINYTSITLTEGTLPTVYTSFDRPDGDIQLNGTANTHPAVTPDHWVELASVDDTRIFNHSQTAGYVPGQVVTDIISTYIFRCIDGVDGITNPGAGTTTNITNIRDARIVDDQGIISLAIRFFTDQNPRANGNTGTTRWTFTANIHSDGSAVSAEFVGTSIVSDTRSANVLLTAASEWLIRIPNLENITGNFPTTVSNVSSVDFLDVSHASLHTGGFNPRPGADPMHWERIGSDLPNEPSVDGLYRLNRTTPTTPRGPDNTAFVTNGSTITSDPTPMTIFRIGGGVAQLTGNRDGAILLEPNEFTLSTNQTSTFASDYSAANLLANNTDINIGDGLALLLDASGSANEPENAAELLTTSGGTAGNHILVSSRTDANNWWLCLIDETNRTRLNDSPNVNAGTFYRISTPVDLAGTSAQFIVGHNYDIVYGPRDSLLTDARPLTPVSAWEPVPEVVSSERAIWEGVSPIRGPFTPPVGTRTDNVQTQNIAFVETFSLGIDPTLTGNGVIQNLPNGHYMVSITATFVHVGTTAGGNRSAINVDLQQGDARSGANDAWTTRSRSGGYIRGSDELPETTLVIKKIIEVTGDTDNDLRAVVYRHSTSDNLTVTLLGSSNSFIIDRIR